MTQIIVQYTPHYASGAVGSKNHTDFTDWFEFADWLKQTNLTGCTLAIHEWHYLTKAEPEPERWPCGMLKSIPYTVGD